MAAVYGATWAAPTVLGAVAGFVVVVCMWWIYFDAGAESAAKGLQEEDGDGADHQSDDPGGRYDVFVYGHLPVTVGIAVAAVGVKKLSAAPDQVPHVPGILLAAGLALFLTGMAVILVGTSSNSAGSNLWPLLGVAGAPAVLAIPTGLLTLAAAAGGMVVLATLGTWLARSPRAGPSSSTG